MAFQVFCAIYKGWQTLIQENSLDSNGRRLNLNYWLEQLPSTTQEDVKGEGEGKDPEGTAVSSEAGIDEEGVNYSPTTGHQVWQQFHFFFAFSW